MFNLLFFRRSFLYVGGLSPNNIEAYNNNVQHISPHFDQHTPRVSSTNHDTMDDIEPSQPRKRFFYLGFAYMISSKAAAVISKLVNDRGFVVPVDFVLIKLMDLLDGGCYTLNPQLAYRASSS